MVVKLLPLEWQVDMTKTKKKPGAKIELKPEIKKSKLGLVLGSFFGTIVGVIIAPRTKREEDDELEKKGRKRLKRKKS